MSKFILKSINCLAGRAAENGCAPEDSVMLANAADQLATAFCKLKDIELHEKFHLDAQNTLTGEDLGKGPIN